MPIRRDGYCDLDGCNQQQTVYRWLGHWYCERHLPAVGKRELRRERQEREQRQATEELKERRP